MTSYEGLYYQLFAAIADAVDALEQTDYGTARRILIEAQRSAEEQIISQEP